VAAGLGVSVIPMQVGSVYTAFANVKLVPLTDDWASRRFAVCFRDEALLQPAALRMLQYLERVEPD
jgi:DNA-binding transcriptional LysR family regulator